MGAIMSVPFPAIKMSEYAALVGYSQCAFFGVNANDNNYACRAIWSYAERDILQRALLEAQEELEGVIHYPLSARWFTNERHNWGNPIVAKWGHIIEGGVMVDTMIEAGATVDYTNDPAIITVDLGLCDPDNVHVFLPGTDIEIEIGSIALTPGSASVTYDIAIDHLDNPDIGWQYAQVDNGEHWGTNTVDVRCIANNPATQAVIISKSACCQTVPCSDDRDTGCIYVRNEELGFVDVTPATYSGGVWTRDCSVMCDCPKWVLLNYHAGETTLTRQQSDTLIRLAHSKMAVEPCGCDVTQRLWKRDRNIPDVLDAARLECPFGMSDGAWTAWKFATQFAIRRGGLTMAKRSINAGRY
jgi:hypothetical protein